MAYIDGKYLNDKYPDVIQDMGGYPSQVIDIAIQEASDEIDLYVSKYLPFNTVPNILKSICSDIAIYRIKQDEVTDLDGVRYKEALSKLKLIRDGDVNINQSATPSNVDSVRNSVWDRGHLDGIDMIGY